MKGGYLSVGLPPHAVAHASGKTGRWVMHETKGKSGWAKRRKITQGQKMGVSRLASGRGIERGVQGNDYRSSDDDEGGQRAEPQRALALLACAAAAARLGDAAVGLAGTYPPRDRVKGRAGDINAFRGSTRIENAGEE
ncbi:hypothetical protein C8J57DRAFT_1228416 [Mycena rebaudengoi]|nr:hypothetical protein C8J57DRAFT_1228416 [Mycena rebaudengoi]